MYSKTENVEYYLQNDFLIIIDSCSLLYTGASVFWLKTVPLLEKNKKQIIIPFAVLNEIIKHKNTRNKTGLSETARKVYDDIENMKKAQFVVVRGNEKEVLTDKIFLVQFSDLRRDKKLLLITQNEKLATDILNLNSVTLPGGKEIHVKKIDKSGYLTDIGEKVQQKFRQVNSITNRIIKIDYLPKENDLVYDSTSQYRLARKISSGGEGKIYTTNKGAFIAKIYDQDKITERRLAKLKRMLSKKMEYDGICFPLSLLSNSKGQFVGYLMNVARGIELRESLFIKPALLEIFPNWKKKDTVELCVTILKKIKYLHDNSILIGDINERNILIKTPREVYFVDTDSFQIEDFPCPVARNPFIPPELQNKDNFDTFLRTIGNENFSVATLLFMIMLPGKSPYAHIGGDDYKTNILAMDFSYPCGDLSNKKTPAGPWRFIWSHLPRNIKELFYKTFKGGEEYSTEHKRLSVSDWLGNFEWYLSILNDGSYGSKDSMSEEIFPTRFKKSPFDEEYHCANCGRSLIYTNRDKISGKKRHNLCTDCFYQGNVIRYQGK